MPNAFVVLPTGEMELKNPKGLKDLQELVGGPIQYLPYPERDDVVCYINEEGKLPIHPFEEEVDGKVVVVNRELPLNEKATKIMAPVMFDDDCIVGSMIVIGFDPETGEEKDLPLSAVDLFLPEKHEAANMPLEEAKKYIGKQILANEEIWHIYDVYESELTIQGVTTKELTASWFRKTENGGEAHAAGALSSIQKLVQEED